jgi:hypothetical protein
MKKHLRNQWVAYVAIVVTALALYVVRPGSIQAQGGTRNAVAYGYTEISSKTSTQVKSGMGILHTLTVTNAGTSWTFQIFDNTACSGTAIAGGSAFTGVAGTLTFDAGFSKGLCIVTAGTTAGTATVTFL